MNRTFQVVLRRWADDDPEAFGRVEREVEALSALSDRKFRAPRLVAHDTSGLNAGVRCVVMNKVSGSVIVRPSNLYEWASRLAEVQAEIHKMPPTLTATTPGWFAIASDFSWIDDIGLRADALAAAQEVTSEKVFVHGDYQQFNVVWERDEVSAVLDWTRTGIGNRGVDVGHTRLNLAALYSVELAAAYLNYYEAAADVSVDSRAELRALLCWNPRWIDFSVPREHLSTMHVDVYDMRLRVLALVRSSVRRLN